MKMITCCSFKGGAGKTTALMGLCSAMAAGGRRVALIEADENRPLSKWRENARRAKTWDETCEVFVADELALLEAAYDEAEQRGFDYALADTHGGMSELNNTIIASSEFLLVPTMLTPLDIDEALATYRYIIELLMAENLTAQTAILRQRVPVGRLTTSQQTATKTLSKLPQFETPMYERDAYAAMKDRGMLHMCQNMIRDNPGMRLMLLNQQRALDELAVLSGFIERKLGA